ncbi:aldehyde dehydrogenase [Ramlibacter albus]|uniref:4-(hydroxymethyl)benzenesulfonate dehydrogenase n=1 Tax=Ramlibacter albus TaxID=2079448 RepID=A0A923ME23_9BURK|nr:aldehyde dehydrogenase [Ramlibacter albus]MBC5767861.1 aldehyde dehydrogenase [Ramlibacter albus]
MPTTHDLRTGEVRGFRMLIAGEWRSASDGETFESIDPYTRRAWARVPRASAADVDAAVTAARQAFESGPWASMLPAQRARLLRKLGELLEGQTDELTHVQVLENGKLIREVGGQVKGLASQCYYFAGMAESLHGHTVPVSVPDMVNYTVREPIGVIAAVTPWNSPLSLLFWKLCPALAAGNTMVIKPSEVTPVSTLVLAELFEKAGFPPGVVNVVTGDARTGAALANHPGVDKIAFTGSTQAGKSVATAAAQRLARVSLELGGKSPNIIFPDADIAGAVNGVLAGIFAATGQTCLAGSRALVHVDIMDAFAAALVEKTRRIRIGDPLDPETEMGTVSCRMQYDKVLQYIEIAKAEGATLLCGGRHPTDPALQQGLFVEPTIFGNVRNDMRIAQEEVFGPVLCLIPFTDEDDAVRIANDSRFGLAAGVWTNDIKRAHRMTRRLRAGTVWVNTYRRTNYATPFGGMKESGLGRENGLEAIYDYTETKSVWIDTGAGIKDPFNPRA